MGFLKRNFLFPKRNIPIEKIVDLCYDIYVKFNFGRYIMTVNYNKLWKKLIDLKNFKFVVKYKVRRDNANDR